MYERELFVAGEGFGPGILAAIASASSEREQFVAGEGFEPSTCWL